MNQSLTETSLIKSGAFVHAFRLISGQEKGKLFYLGCGFFAQLTSIILSFEKEKGKKQTNNQKRKGIPDQEI